MPAKANVNRPITATNRRTAGAISNSGISRATRNTPAATIVAAWISALTGAGPSMASGSQTWNGNWADLPIAPRNTRNIARLTVPWEISPVPTPFSTAWMTPLMSNVPVAR